jgi:hypothetical protein
MTFPSLQIGMNRGEGLQLLLARVDLEDHFCEEVTWALYASPDFSSVAIEPGGFRFCSIDEVQS